MSDLPLGARKITAAMLRPRQMASLAANTGSIRFAQLLSGTITEAVDGLSPVAVRVTLESVTEEDQAPQADNDTPILLKSGSAQLGAFLRCDRALVFAITDIALGGTGTEPPELPEERPLSGIERAIRDLVLAKIAISLQAALATSYDLAALAPDPEFKPGPESPSARYLCFRYLLNVYAYSAEITLGLKLDDLKVQIAAAASQHADDARDTWTLKSSVDDCQAQITMLLASETLTVGEISRLHPGQLLTLRTTVHTPVIGKSGGVTILSGTLARSAGRLAVRLV